MPAYRGEAGQQVNIKIMEYSERNVRQLASNEQEEYIPRKINVGVINTPTLIDLIINQTNIVNPSNLNQRFSYDPERP